MKAFFIGRDVLKAFFIGGDVLKFFFHRWRCFETLFYRWRCFESLFYRWRCFESLFYRWRCFESRARTRPCPSLSLLSEHLVRLTNKGSQEHLHLSKPSHKASHAWSSEINAKRIWKCVKVWIQPNKLNPIHPAASPNYEQRG